MPVNSKLSKDIQDERHNVTFNIEELTNWYYGSVKNVEEKRFLGKKIRNV